MRSKSEPDVILPIETAFVGWDEPDVLERTSLLGRQMAHIPVSRIVRQLENRNRPPLWRGGREPTPEEEQGLKLIVVPERETVRPPVADLSFPAPQSELAPDENVCHLHDVGDAA